jgi:hypothetical protein
MCLQSFWLLLAHTLPCKFVSKRKFRTKVDCVCFDTFVGT